MTYSEHNVPGIETAIVEWQDEGHRKTRNRNFNRIAFRSGVRGQSPAWAQPEQDNISLVEKAANIKVAAPLNSVPFPLPTKFLAPVSRMNRDPPFHLFLFFEKESLFSIQRRSESVAHKIY